jgi:hypothetical protein
MSVIITLQASGDPQRLEARAAQDPDGMRAIADRAEQHGLIAHRFYGSEDGRIMVVDEWPDLESFRRFFDEMRPEIEPLFRDAGITGDPDLTSWRKLETHDEVGWDR